MQLHKEKSKERMDYTKIILEISEFFFMISFCNESFFEKHSRTPTINEISTVIT